MTYRDTVISLFDYTGNFVLPWVECGYNAVLIDIKHPKGITGGGSIQRIGHDLSKPPLLFRDMLDRVAFVAAFPPCTHLAVSGARWFKGKGLRALADAINMFATAAEFCEQQPAPYLIENPVSTISTYWRNPDYTFDPYHYQGYELADNYTKKTCLWTGNGFVMPPHKRVDDTPPDDRIHKASPSKDRADFRSATALGFARAVFESNREAVT